MGTPVQVNVDCMPGTYGVVYKAKDLTTKDNRIVALGCCAKIVKVPRTGLTVQAGPDIEPAE